MTQISDLRSSRRSWAPAIAVLGAVVAVAAAIVLIVAPLGYRAGLWPLSIALGFLPQLVAYYAGLAGALVPKSPLPIRLLERASPT